MNETILVRGEHSHFISAPAAFAEEDRLKDSWAADLMTPSDKFKWLVSNYVEADRPNRNRYMWTMQDLEMRSPTVVHAPLNIGHSREYIVGHVAGSQMMYPTAEASEDVRPWIETCSAFYHFHFPHESYAVGRAQAEGKLWSSMECVAETLTCVGEGGCGQTFKYVGPAAQSKAALETYCDCMNSGRGVSRYDNPTFTGQALIMLPGKPAWQGADVTSVAALFEQYADEANQIYEQVAAFAHLDESEREAFTLVSLARAHEPTRGSWDAVDGIASRIAREFSLGSK